MWEGHVFCSEEITNRRTDREVAFETHIDELFQKISNKIH